jgi:mRNA-degrading endonuclease RelE of RelBE toxin-antitoxin system
LEERKKFVIILYTEEFYRQLKRLAKRYRSLADDIDTLQHELMENPDAGVSLGGGKRKIRLGVKSKGGGKRGGLRVITLNVVVDIIDTCINLLTIYDKKEISNVSEKYIDEIIRNL